MGSGNSAFELTLGKNFLPYESSVPAPVILHARFHFGPGGSKELTGFYINFSAIEIDWNLEHTAVCGADFKDPVA